MNILLTFQYQVLIIKIEANTIKQIQTQTNQFYFHSQIKQSYQLVQKQKEIQLFNMRTSFVQRLKNQKQQTMPTRQSQQKSTNKSIKKTKLPIYVTQFNHHHADIKKLLNILEETKSNTNSFTQNLKQNKKAQIIKETILNDKNKEIKSKIKKQNFNQLYRLQVISCQKNQKQNNHNNQEIKTNKNKILYSEKLIKHDENDQVQNFVFSKVFINQPIKRKSNIFTNSNLNVKQIRKQNESFAIKPSQVSNKKGLQNIGNTCYINSVLQCLFHIPTFNTYFQRLNYLNDSVNNSTTSKLIVEKYRNLYLYVMKGCSSEQTSTYQLKYALSKSCSLFLAWQQQDAHEFLRKLLDCMHVQLNRITSSSAYRLLKTQTKLQHSSISSLADEYYNYYKQRDDSFVYDSFGGQIYNNVRCVGCAKQSISFDNFLDLSLSIVKGKNQLTQLMDQFFNQEKLNDFYKCDFCNQVNKHSVKTSKIWRTPEILIIHLKRSQFGKKNNQKISFPTELLSLKNYMNNQNSKISNKHSNYTLKGVVCHRGVIQGGHYWSVVRQYGQWYQVDDDKVSNVSSSEIKRLYQVEGSSQPYILFYSSMNK